MLGVKDSGRVPMAWSIRPGFRGDLVLCDGGLHPRKGNRPRTGREKNLQGGAQNRVLRAV